MTSKEIGLKKIQELVTRFSEQLTAYKKSEYNETQTRRDFIDPFFKALGWDIDNEQGFAESYREVIHEDRVKIGTATKAPDYSFRLSGGQRLFFVEAKKPSVLIKDDIQPAYQVRRYGWSAKLNVSVITDFEEFAIYDCTKKPNPNDKTSVARVKYITYNDYISEWEFLWNTFSKEAVLKGSFDKFIGGNANKKGTATVDKEFLNSLDQWRTLLAETISKENKELDEDELNFVVQQTLDRIIFLRICEDRSIEPYGKLKECLNRGDYYANLLLEFKQADEKYNSGLFNFKKDKLSHQIKINNKTLKTIISQLYYPECPYEFSVLSVEILGSAYEQFLGKTITINNRGKAVIELKPEVRKAGGVYYTPQYVVDYIVKNTVGKLCENKTPTQVTEIKILDPACGSGSFLIGAYHFLLNWHKDYYLQNPNKKNPLTPDGNLTTPEKKKILLNNIYGVDIDTNAVEVTKLSLLLKCMEGETQASIAHQMKMFNERVLPTLDDNIKSGNSLIDMDYYDNQFDFGEEKKIKPFSWQKAYPTIYKNGGFDVVIGNPPYVMLQNLETREVFDYALRKFQSAKYKIDTYQIFTEQSIKLLNDRGLLGLITPNTFLKNIHAEPLRKYILDTTSIKEILLFNYSVFAAASVDTCIFVLEKGKANKKSELQVNTSDSAFEVKNITSINQTIFLKNNRTDFNLLISNSDTELLNKFLKNSKALGDFCGAYFGIQTFDRTKYVSETKKNNYYEPVIDGRNIETYNLKPSTEYVHYIPTAIKSGGSEAIYRQDRICIRQIGATPVATFVPANILTLNTIYNVYLKEKNSADLKFLLGVISSKTTKYFWKKNNSDEKKTFPKIKKEAILSIPVPIINKQNKNLHDEISKLVNQLLQFNKELQTLTLETKKEQVKQKIEYGEDKINELVYQLYELTKEEIILVESN